MKQKKYVILIISFILLSIQLHSSNIKQKTGLVLTGGGARGFAHIGILKQLEKYNIKPDIIAGTSMGALIGSYYSVGFTPQQIENIMVNENWEAIFSNDSLRTNIKISERISDYNNFLLKINFDFKGIVWDQGVNKGFFFENAINSKLGIYSAIYKNNFDNFPIPIRISATDFKTGETLFFKDGYLPKINRASLAYPGLLEPIIYQNRTLIDGFLFSNIPVKILKEENIDYLIVSNTTLNMYKNYKSRNLLDVFQHTLRIASMKNDSVNLKNSNLTITPNLKKYSSTNFTNLNNIIKAGENAVTDKIIFKIKSVVSENELKKNKIDVSKYYITKINYHNINFINKSIIKNYVKLLRNTQYDSKLIENVINNLYGTGYFDYISYEFKISNDTNLIMDISFTEKKYATFKFGMYIDEYYNTIGCLGLTKKGIDKIGSNLDINFHFGLNRKINLKYTTLKISNLGINTVIEGEISERQEKIYLNNKLFEKKILENKNLSLSANKTFKMNSVISAKLKFIEYNWKNNTNNYSKLKINYFYDNIQNLLYPKNSHKINIYYEKFLNNFLNKSEKYSFRMKNYFKLNDKIISYIYSGLEFSNNELIFPEKFILGGPELAPGYFRNQFKSNNNYHLSVGFNYKIRDYKTLIKRKLFFSFLTGINEISNTKNFTFNNQNLNFGITCKVTMLTVLGKFEMGYGKNRSSEDLFYFLYGYKI